MSALTRMHESDGSASGFPDTFGIVGLASAVVGIALSESPATARIFCLILSAFCLALSFTGQARWPRWVRWVLSLAADFILLWIAWSVFSRP